MKGIQYWIDNMGYHGVSGIFSEHRRSSCSSLHRDTVSLQDMRSCGMCHVLLWFGVSKFAYTFHWHWACIYDCPSASKITLKNIDKHLTLICQELWHIAQSNKKHSKIVNVFDRISCGMCNTLFDGHFRECNVALTWYIWSIAIRTVKSKLPICWLVRMAQLVFIIKCEDYGLICPNYLWWPRRCTMLKCHAHGFPYLDYK